MIEKLKQAIESSDFSLLDKQQMLDFVLRAYELEREREVERSKIKSLSKEDIEDILFIQNLNQY